MRKTRFSSERGAIIVQMLVAVFVLTGISMFVVDYGIMWVSRNQAQNAADSGALAGAVALALDSFTDHTNAGPAKKSARTFALSTNVFGAKADVDFDTDILFYPDAPAKFPLDCADDSCIRVDVYRNQARGNPLPMWFGMFVGLNEQGVRATATAWAAMANASECLKPWAVPDKWEENYPPAVDKPRGARADDEFDAVVPPGFTPDRYVPPDQPGTTSYTKDDIGYEIRLKNGNPADSINSGWFMALDFNPDCAPGGGGNGADCYRANISGCAPKTWTIGGIPKENGNMVGPTGQGTDDLIAKDPGAIWDSVNKKVIHSCTQPGYGPCPGGMTYAQSPRIVSVPVFDLPHYLDTGGPGKGEIQISNILGVFIDRVTNPQSTVWGFLTYKTDLKVSGGGTVNPDSSFIKAIQLVR